MEQECFRGGSSLLEREPPGMHIKKESAEQPKPQSVSMSFRAIKFSDNQLK
jgi:hypothetical protein